MNRNKQINLSTNDINQRFTEMSTNTLKLENNDCRGEHRSRLLRRKKYTSDARTIRPATQGKAMSAL